MTLITIASIEPKEPRSVVVTTENKRLGFWADKAHLFNFEVGGTYEVNLDIKTFDGGRKLTNITEARLVDMGTQTAPQTTQPISNRFDDKSEQIFVVALLKSLIEAGQIKNDKKELWEATNMLRGLWKHSFGFNVFTPSEAGKRVA